MGGSFWGAVHGSRTCLVRGQDTACARHSIGGLWVMFAGLQWVESVVDLLPLERTRGSCVYWCESSVALCELDRKNAVTGERLLPLQLVQIRPKRQAGLRTVNTRSRDSRLSAWCFSSGTGCWAELSVGMPADLVVVLPTTESIVVNSYVLCAWALAPCKLLGAPGARFRSGHCLV